MTQVKPPIGLTPKFIRDEERLAEVKSAIHRYYDEGLTIPVEWIEEYNALIDSVNKESNFTSPKLSNRDAIVKLLIEIRYYDTDWEGYRKTGKNPPISSDKFIDSLSEKYQVTIKK